MGRRGGGEEGRRGGRREKRGVGRRNGANEDCRVNVYTIVPAIVSMLIK